MDKEAIPMQTMNAKPAWLSQDMYPFEAHYFPTSVGTLHYVDEGQGRPIVFVHGNPSWSFEFRHLIKDLSKDYRCIAVDHIGFGLSSKSATEEGSHPQQHAARLRALLEHLDLNDVTLVLADWGGPIGLDFAVTHPDRVSGVVIFNTWGWPVNGDLHFEMYSWMMSSPVLQFWIRYFNLFVNVVFPMAIGVKEAMTREVMDHYRGPLEKIEDRHAHANFPYYVLAARSWLEEIWSQREKIADKPALIIWGGADIAFREKEMNVWKQTLRNATAYCYKQAGHMVAEEIPDTVIGHMREFLAKTEAPALAPVAA
jgi:haloalkane dehalogenase